MGGTQGKGGGTHSQAFAIQVASPGATCCPGWVMLSLPPSGQQKLIDPETFRDFYTCWKETEAQAQEVSLPAAVTEHLYKNERVYKLSGSVKTSRGVGKIAMTQKRLFLLTEGRPGYEEIATFRNIQVGSRGPSHAGSALRWRPDHRPLVRPSSPPTALPASPESQGERNPL